MSSEAKPNRGSILQHSSRSAGEWGVAGQFNRDRLGDPSPSPSEMEDAEILHASIKAGSIAQIVIAAIAVIGLIYLLKVVLVTTLTAILFAFVMEPMVKLLTRIHVPRAVGSLVAVILMIAMVLGFTYFFYNRAVNFATELPKYSGKIHTEIARFRAQTSKIEEGTRSMMASPSPQKRAVPVEIQEPLALTRVLSAGAGLGDVFLGITFVPFLVYFMLTWKDHVHSNAVRIFPNEHRLAAYRTVARISEMIRTFIAGSVAVGLMNAVVSGVVFWRLGIPYFYFIGAISGFAGLIPYVGVFLALLPPVAGGMGILNKTGFLAIVLTVVGLHAVTAYAVFPKLVGKRLRLNPLAVTVSLLFWAWIWGAMGLILAVPLVGAAKIVCDYVDSLHGIAAWLGD
jgi:predicted PurR-regulated permease PerM